MQIIKTWKENIEELCRKAKLQNYKFEMTKPQIYIDSWFKGGLTL